MKSKEPSLNNENIKQEIDSELILILEIKLQKEHFVAKYHRFFNYWMVYFQAMLGWENKHVCPKSTTEK